jgi:YidC/Oxa1 family membrane protein insertase
MESRALIAFTLSIAILVGYQWWLVRRNPAIDHRPQAVQPLRVPESEPASVPRPVATDPQVQALPRSERVVRIETDRYDIVATSAGGRLRSIGLKNYRETAEPNSPPHDLIPDGSVLPLGVYWTRPDGSIGSDAQVDYALNLEERPDDTFTLSMSGTSPQGDTISKRLSGSAGAYVLSYEVEVGVEYETSLGVAWARAVSPNVDRLRVVEGPVVLIDGSLKSISAHGLEEPVTLKGVVDWAGYADHYFVIAYYPAEATDLRFSAVAGAGNAEATLWADVSSPRVSYQLYAGPKKLAELRKVGHRLEESVDLGWFAFIARPLLELMLLLNKFTGNYGWSIILLTVAVRLVFYPINKRQALAMKAMQKVQPELKRIQEKFKDDRERLNRELMEVYRRHKVNPLAGCLPMLLQLPVFLGLYNALMQSIELRHAPFLGWITDLSQPDRLGSLAIPFVQPPGVPVLTLLMGASMIAQQKMMPAAGDPTQQKMMMFMPVIFTVMFINFPSGLVLYWFASNLMSIAQQYMTNRSGN